MKRVMVFGTFDILHPGHIDFLRQARKLGDYLIVSLACGKFIKKIKGHPAAHSESERLKLLESLRLVDKAVLGSKTDYLQHIKAHKPHVIALGYDQKAFTEGLKRKLADMGLKVKVVRLKPYKKHLYKSSKFLKRL